MTLGDLRQGPLLPGPLFARSKFSAPRLVSRLVPRSRLFEELDQGAGRRPHDRGGRCRAPARRPCSPTGSRPVQTFRRRGSAATQATRTRSGSTARSSTHCDTASTSRASARTLRELLSLDGEASIDAVARSGRRPGESRRCPRHRHRRLSPGGVGERPEFGHFLESRPLSLRSWSPPGRTRRCGCTGSGCGKSWSRSATPTWPSPRTRRRVSSPRSGSTCPTDDIEAVHRRTEGWSAGLQMAALSIQTSPDPVTSVRRAEVDSNTVAGYFLEEVLYRQPQAVVDFMLASSVLDELSVAACTAVMGQGAAPSSSICPTPTCS